VNLFFLHTKEEKQRKIKMSTNEGITPIITNTKHRRIKMFGTSGQNVDQPTFSTNILHKTVGLQDKTVRPQDKTES
jgi:hypothetical protein